MKEQSMKIWNMAAWILWQRCWTQKAHLIHHRNTVHEQPKTEPTKDHKWKHNFNKVGKSTNYWIDLILISPQILFISCYASAPHFMLLPQNRQKKLKLTPCNLDTKKFLASTNLGMLLPYVPFVRISVTCVIMRNGQLYVEKRLIVLRP